jgi:hypothetical protein
VPISLQRSVPSPRRGRIALEDGLIVRNSPEDPLYRLRVALGARKFDQLAEKTIESVGP